MTEGDRIGIRSQGPVSQLHPPVTGQLRTSARVPDDGDGVPKGVTVERDDRLTTERLVTFREVPGTDE
jgi:hypothetical protein